MANIKQRLEYAASILLAIALVILGVGGLLFEFIPYVLMPRIREGLASTTGQLDAPPTPLALVLASLVVFATGTMFGMWLEAHRRRAARSDD